MLPPQDMQVVGSLAGACFGTKGRFGPMKQYRITPKIGTKMITNTQVRRVTGSKSLRSNAEANTTSQAIVQITIAKISGAFSALLARCNEVCMKVQ